MNDFIAFGKRLYKEAIVPSVIMAGIAIVITVAYWVVRFATPVQVQVLSAALTPAIAMLAVAVAVAQWRTARNKLKLDLFDRRYAIFATVSSTLEQATKHRTATRDQIDTFLAGTQSAEFLFDHEMYCFTQDIGRRLFVIKNTYPRLSPMQSLAGGQDDKAREEHGEAMRWLISQRMELHAKFGDYLRLQH